MKIQGVFLYVLSWENFISLVDLNDLLFQKWQLCNLTSLINNFSDHSILSTLTINTFYFPFQIEVNSAICRGLYYYSDMDSPIRAHRSWNVAKATTATWRKKKKKFAKNKKEIKIMDWLSKFPHGIFKQQFSLSEHADSVIKVIIPTMFHYIK